MTKIAQIWDLIETFSFLMDIKDIKNDDFDSDNDDNNNNSEDNNNK